MEGTLMKHSILPGVDLPKEVECLLAELDNHHRFVKNFAVIGYACAGLTRTGSQVHRLGIYVPDTDKKIWGGFRQTLQSQLLDAGVLSPWTTVAQELAWRELRQVLYQFKDRSSVDNVVFEGCRNATLQGWVDSLESRLPLCTYLRCKGLIKELGQGAWEQDFAWYFGCSVPDDYYRGLED